MRIWLVIGCALGACDKGSAPAERKEPKLEPPAPELPEVATALDLPPVPTFAAPEPLPDGAHTARELRLAGRRYLTQEVTVAGVVSFVYDCAAVVGAEVARSRPEQCSRPYLLVGDSRDDLDGAIWVVETPRDAGVAVGDPVRVTGRWDTRTDSHTAEDGLLVYAALQVRR